MFWKSLIFAFLLAGVFADEYTIPAEHSTQIQDILKEQCKKAGNEDKAEDVKKAGINFMECVKGLIDIPTLKNEIELAKPNGALDEVFKKYCAKTPLLKTCIHTLLDEVSPCLEATSRDQINNAKNGTDKLIDFVCYKDGDRIALFIAESGPECFKEKVEQIRTCLSKIQDIVKTPEAAKALTPVEKCGKFDELTNCIVKETETCDNPTPSNMAESLFKYVRKDSPCNKILPLKN